MPWPSTLEHTALLAAPCVCVFVCVCLSVDRSDTSFICFELSVDYLSAASSYSVLAWDGLEGGGRWRGRSGKRGRKREKQREDGGFLLLHKR